MFKNKKTYKYPSNWDEEDIYKFNSYFKQTKEMYDNMPDNLIELCCEREINEQKGLIEPIDYSKIEKLDVDIKPYEEF